MAALMRCLHAKRHSNGPHQPHSTSPTLPDRSRAGAQPIGGRYLPRWPLTPASHALWWSVTDCVTQCINNVPCSALGMHELKRNNTVPQCKVQSQENCHQFVITRVRVVRNQQQRRPGTSGHQGVGGAQPLPRRKSFDFVFWKGVLVYFESYFKGHSHKWPCK